MRKPKQKLIIEVEVEAVHVRATETLVDLLIRYPVDHGTDVRFSVDDQKLSQIEWKEREK